MTPFQYACLPYPSRCSTSQVSSSSAMTSQTFRYGPLSQPAEIRLLILEPAAANSSPLRGCLQNTTISACDRVLIDSYTARAGGGGGPGPAGGGARGRADAK